MKKRVLILAGGYSKERDISLKTARAVYKQIKNNYFCKILDPKNGFIKEIKKFRPNVVFNALHGRYGEDGYIQLILENEKIKYTHSGVKASSICINKVISKKIFLKNKILTPKNIKKLENEREILIEKYIPGREIQVAVMGKKTLGTIELVPKRKFYDYKAKYDKNAKTKHVLPVNLSEKELKKVENIALNAHRITGCRGITRSDFRYYDDKFYLLEVNTQPGMTELSLVPEIAKYKGISFYKLINWIIKDASINR